MLTFLKWSVIRCTPPPRSKWRAWGKRRAVTRGRCLFCQALKGMVNRCCRLTTVAASTVRTLPCFPLRFNNIPTPSLSDISIITAALLVVAREIFVLQQLRSTKRSTCSSSRLRVATTAIMFIFLFFCSIFDVLNASYPSFAFPILPLIQLFMGCCYLWDVVNGILTPTFPQHLFVASVT